MIYLWFYVYRKNVYKTLIIYRIAKTISVDYENSSILFAHTKSFKRESTSDQ